MVDDGYLVGYEDGSGNFVEVGRFNNTSENVSDPLIIQHSDSGQQMELGPDGFSTESVSTNELLINQSTLYQSSSFVEVISSGVDGEPNDTTSNTYEFVGHASGGLFPLNNVPSAATVYGRFVARLENSNAGETTFVLPELYNVTDDTFTTDSLSELEISKTGEGSDGADSGWVEITSITPDDLFTFTGVRARVSGGTGGFAGVGNAGLSIGWRLD